MFLPDYLLGVSFIAAIFFISWIFMYPSILWESITFRNNEGVKGYLMSLGTILFLVGFANSICFLAEKFG